MTKLTFPTTRRYIEYGRSEMRSVVERLSTEGIAA